MAPLLNESLTQPDLSVSPRAFFDGAEQEGHCGCGVFILVSEICHFHLFWNGSRGSNTKAEAMALAGLLQLCFFLDL